MHKEILLNTARLLISKLIPALLLTLINVIYSRVLTPSDYGSYQVVWTYLNVFAVLTVFGLPKYIISSGNSLSTESFRKLFQYSLFIFLSIFFLIGAYLFVFFKQFDFYSCLFFLVLLLSQTIYLIQEAYVIADNGNKKLIWINVAYAFLLFAVHILIYYVIGYQLSYCILGITLVSLIRNGLLWTMTTRSVFARRIAASGIGTDFSLVFWVGLNDSLQIFTKWMDKLVLVFILPAAEYAVYYNGTFELPLIGMFLLAFQSIITLYGAKQTGDKMYQIELFRSSSLLMSVILFPLFAWMFWYAIPIVQILFGSKYEESGSLFALTALYLPIRICSYTVLLQLAGKGRAILTGSIIDFILSLLFMAVLYPFFKLHGLILALVLSTYIQALFYLFRIKEVYKVTWMQLLPFSKLFYRLAVSVIIVGGVNYALSYLMSPVFNFIIGSVVAFLLFLCFFKNSINIKEWVFLNK